MRFDVYFFNYDFHMAYHVNNFIISNAIANYKAIKCHISKTMKKYF